ncbi:CENPB DNA-binding domain-containing protein 1, partial [Python bivittatus]|uniref:CENPB DNA-binding domain-containing protein 1 n=1 Tax=Python bivittatus TaxID=176946 RepID=A0A9F2WEX7_PYTBI
MEMKVEILKKIDWGKKVANVVHAYGMNRFMIGMIIKNKEKIMEHVKSSVPIQSMIISKRRGKVMEELERLLGMWIEDQHQRHVLLSLMLIQEKAKSLFHDLQWKTSEDAAEETFVASHGWFVHFRAHVNLHNVK